MALTEKQKRFVEEYVMDYNATQAALRAGYSERTASTSGYRNTKNDEIQVEIKKKQKEMREQLQQQFSSDAIIARKIMLDIMADDDAPENVRLSAAKDFLDRAGFKPIDKSEVEHSGDMNVNNPFADLTTEELRKLADADGDD